MAFIFVVFQRSVCFITARDIQNRGVTHMNFSFFNNFSSGTLMPRVHVIKLNLHTLVPSSESNLPIFVF